MRQDWEPENLIEVWTLLEDDMKRVRNKSGATRLGFALLLKLAGQQRPVLDPPSRERGQEAHRLQDAPPGRGRAQRLRLAQPM